DTKHLQVLHKCLSYVFLYCCLMVSLLFSVQQVEVVSGEEPVLLPWKTTFHIEDVSQVTMEWMDGSYRKVHVYEDGSDRTDEQDSMYRNRTEMNEDPLRAGDLSLTLKHPTVWDTNIYICVVYDRDNQILMKKEVHLKVKGQYCRHRSFLFLEYRPLLSPFPGIPPHWTCPKHLVPHVLNNTVVTKCLL
uniref:Immunoglobulin V-set domain-containing protein n=1 Tax=Sphaeramia orbicularis TaxID=375764 RepID=A0A672YKX4_9TELE